MLAEMTATKTCKGCGEIKPFEEFRAESKMRDGRTNRCKECTRAQTRAWNRANPERKAQASLGWRRANPEKQAALTRAWEAENWERVLETAERSRKRYPEKYRARTALNHAVQDGTVTRPDRCERCNSRGKPFSDGRSPIQGHHHDYTKPLEVEWLCHDCHVDRHLKEGEPVVSFIEV